MNIALIGYGKMGKAIEQVAIQRHHAIVLRIDKHNMQDITQLHEMNVDVVIEFSTPETAVQNIQQCLSHKIPVVIGTTGWYSHYENIVQLATQQQTSFIAATNFSLGVNLFFSINKYVAKLMQPYDYDVEITEIHHTQKLDAPSGTAISLANDIMSVNKNYILWQNEANTANNVLPIISKREENVPGTHIIKYENEIDEIRITHTAKNRTGFALGAVLSAEYLHKNPFGVYTMQHVLNLP